MNDVDKAEGYFLHVIQKTDSNFDAWIALSEIYMIHEEYEEAIQCCYKAKKCEPNNTSYLLMLALIKHNMGWDSEAIHVLDEMKQRDPNNPSIYNLFGIIYKDRCMYKQSIESFMKGLELAPYQIISIENIVDIYWETGNFELAHNVITKALELFSGNDCLSLLEYKKTVLDSLLIQDESNPKSNVFEKYLNSSKLQLGFNQLPLGFRSVAIEKSAHNNISLLKYHNGDIEGALTYLLSSFNIDPIIFTQDIYNNQTINNLYSMYPHTLRLLWFYFTKLGCPKTSLVLMQLMYDRHTMTGKKPGGKDSSTIFWYYIALASAGSPWKLLDYSKWIFDEVTKRDDCPFYMQVYAYNRMEIHTDNGKMNSKLKIHIENCLNEATKNGKLMAVDFEKALYYYNIEDYNNATLSIPKVSNISDLSPEFQLLQAKILYKKKSSISARQALQILSNLQRASPKNYEYVYLRLKLFSILDDSNFASIYRDFNPITLEFQIKKFKLGTKYYINHFDIEKSRSEFEKLEKVVESIDNWAKSNKIEKAQIFNMENYKSSIYFLKANISYISNETYFSTMNSMHSISADYMKKPKSIIFELKFSQHSPSTQYYQNQFYEKAQNALKQIDPKFQSIGWQWIIIYLLSNGMKKQALIVSNNMGSTRFARIDTLYPLCKIAFLIGLNDNLESYLSKLDLSIIKMQAKSIETRQLLSEFDLFKLRVTMNKFNRSNSNNEYSSLVEEFKMNFNNLWPYLSHLKGLYRENICEILSSYLSLTNYFNDNFIQKIVNEVPDIIPYPFAKNLLDKSVREDEKKKNFEMVLKSHSETMNSDKKINSYLLETLKKGDVSLLNSKEMNTVSDLTNFARQINGSTYENIIKKMIGERKFFTTEKIQVTELVLNDKFSSMTLQWIQYELSKRNQTKSFFDFIQESKDGISNSNNRNIFSSIENIANNENFDFVKTVETIASRYQEPIIQSHLILLQIMKLDQANHNHVDSSEWYLNHDNLLSLAQDFIQRNTDPLEMEQEKEDQSETKDETLQIILNEEFDAKYIHGKKNSLFWKCIFYIFNDSSNDEIIKERIHLICEQTSNVDDLSVNLDFILHEWSIKDESLKFRLNKIQEKTCGEFLNLLYTMLSDCYSYLEMDDKKVFDFVLDQLLKQSKSTIRKSKKADWKEFIDFIKSVEENSITSSKASLFNVRRISENGIVDWRICYALLNSKTIFPDNVSFPLMSMMLESVIIMFSSLFSSNNYMSKRSFKIEEVLSQTISNMCPSTFGSFTYQPDFESQKPSVYYCVQFVLNDYLEILSNLIDYQDTLTVRSLLRHCINVLSYLIEYKFIEKNSLESVLFCTRWAKISSFIIGSFRGEELNRLISLFFFKDSSRSVHIKYSALEISNFLMEFMRFSSRETFEKFMSICEDSKFKVIQSSLLVVNNVLFNNLDSTIHKDEFFSSLIDVFKYIGKSHTIDTTFKWMLFVNVIEISKFSYGNNNNLWEMRIFIDREYEQNDLKEPITVTLSPIPTMNLSNLEIFSSHTIQNFIGIGSLKTMPILKIGGIFFKITRKQSNSSFRDLQTLKSLNFSLKKSENVLYQYFIQYGSQNHSAMSYDVETRKKNTVVVTKYHIYKNSWYEKCELLVKDLAIWSAISWFIGLSNIDDNSVMFDMERGRIIFDNISCVFSYSTKKEFASPFRLDFDFQNLLQNLNLSHMFEVEFEKCLNHLLTPLNIQMVSNLARKLTKIGCNLEYSNSSKKKSVFLFEDYSHKSNNSDSSETLRVDRYLFEMLKRNLKLERQLAKSRLSSEQTKLSSSINVKQKDQIQENTPSIITPALFGEYILDLLNRRLNGWVLLANSLKQEKSENINFETCGLKCNNIAQLSTELVSQAKLFSK